MKMTSIFTKFIIYKKPDSLDLKQQRNYKH